MLKAKQITPNNWPKQKDVDTFYGNPRGANSQASARWEATNLVRIIPPFTMRYIGTPIKSFRIHKKCSASITRILAAIWLASGKSQTQIDKWGVSLYGGSYNFRLMRGGNHLSMHSYGCAIDLAPTWYPMNDPKHRQFALPVIKAFSDEGWVNLKFDHMHFQAATVSAGELRKMAAAIMRGKTKMHGDRSKREILLDIEHNQKIAFRHLHEMLHLILRKENAIMSKIDDVATAVAEESTVVDSTVTLLDNLTTLIKNAGTDPAALDAVISSITANKDRLAAAVAENTPAATGGSTGGAPQGRHRS